MKACHNEFTVCSYSVCQFRIGESTNGIQYRELKCFAGGSSIPQAAMSWGNMDASNPMCAFAEPRVGWFLEKSRIGINVP